MSQDSITSIHPGDHSSQTAEIMRRFNDVFQLHDPSALAELVAQDCVIENTVPAPDGARHAGKEACIDLWSAIATQPGTRFDLEETSSPVNGRRSAGATSWPTATPSAAST
ncbi:hypothetical protein X748_06915 [Mesorhizobium sp. LNJC386A00]|nr:hypothetical protein X748_06915 [Mesorhizobium sp. LNJC386A00]